MQAPEPLSRLLPLTVQGTPLAKRLEESGIWIAWDRIVGPQIAAQARPGKMRDGVLTVMVASAPWLQQLNFLKGEILQRLNTHLGAPLIKEIYLKAGTLPRLSVAKAVEPLPEHSVTEQDMIAIKKLVTLLPDPELQELCGRLLTTHRRRCPK